MIEFLGIMRWVSAEGLARLGSTPPDQMDALLFTDFKQGRKKMEKSFGLVYGEHEWPMRPSHALKVMLGLGWLQWSDEQHCYRCVPSASTPTLQSVVRYDLACVCVAQPFA